VKVLLDTCVVSEVRHPEGALEVKAAVAALPDEDTFLSVVTLGELAGGVARLTHGRRRRELAEWLEGLQTRFADRILSIVPTTARLWGELDALARHAGRPASASDGLIAATAREHGLNVMTRNVDHFLALGALVVNPWNEDDGTTD